MTRRALPGSMVLTSTRNEGPFLLAWLAWYRMLGFEQVFVIHNDCTDHSPQLLRLLEREGLLTQKKMTPDPEQAPQPQNHRKISRHKALKETDWLFVCDVDEFLIVHTGDGSIAALAEEIDGKGIGMNINWRCFGDGGEMTWEDMPPHRRFRRSGPPEQRVNVNFKTFYKRITDFKIIRTHGPKGWVNTEESFGEEDRVFLLANGEPFPDYHPQEAPRNGSHHHMIYHDLAQVNHYAIQSREQFEFKRGRPSASLKHDRYNDKFFENYNQNDKINVSAMVNDAEWEAEWEAIRAIPGVLRLHHLCCADFIVAMAEKRGANGRRDKRYRYHMNMADRCSHHDSSDPWLRFGWWRRLKRNLGV